MPIIAVVAIVGSRFLVGEIAGNEIRLCGAAGASHGRPFVGFDYGRMAACASFVANVATGRSVSWEGWDRLPEEARQKEQEAREQDLNQFLLVRHCTTPQHFN